MSSLREQLKNGVFTTTSTINKKIHKFMGNFTINEGFCDYEVPEDNYFLLKTGHTNRRNKWHIINR